MYGRPDRLPVDEHHLVRPADINGVNKAAGEYYHLLYNNVFGVRACSLRLTNVYGPRQLIKHNRQGFIGWFIRLAIEGREIQIFGDGSQLRDFVYVDDAADAFLRAGATDACDGEVFNVGGDEPIEPSRSRDAAPRDGGHGIGPLRRLAAGQEADRHRQLLLRLDEVPRDASAGGRRSICARACARTIAFYREHLRPLRGPAAAPPRKRPVIPFLELDARRTTRPSCRRRSSASSSAAGSFSARSSTRSSASSPPRAARRTRVGVGTGTDALAIALRALGIGPGDEVITSPLSAAYSALAIMMAGARPVFADIDPERLTLDPARGRGRGHAADARPSCRSTSTASRPTCRRCCGRRRATVSRSSRTAARRIWRRATGGRSARFGEAARLQLLSDEEPRRARRRRRDHDRRRALAAACPAAAQRRSDRSLSPREFGVNSRLDEMQAAILRARLPLLPALDGAPARARGALSPRARGRRHRRRAARGDAGHVYHLFPVRSASRDAMQAHLTASGVETLIHYPIPIPQQPALATERPADCPVANRVCARGLLASALPLPARRSDPRVDRARQRACRRRQPS